ncbi:MAG: VanZ family protein [Candidatus Pacearchaeota archaeon]
MIKWFDKNREVSLIFVVVIGIIIFFLSSIPGNSLTRISFIAITYHIFIFFLFTFFLFTTFVHGKDKNFILIVILISIFYGIIDEFHQLFTYGRDSSFSDLMVNNIGIFFATLVYLFHLKRQDKNRKI